MKLLVVIDYQNDFVCGSLGFSKAKDLEKPICNKIREYLENGDEVVYTMDTHNQDYLETLEGKNLPVVHCLKNSIGWKLYSSNEEIIQLLRGADCFEKNSFGSKELAFYVEKNHFEVIELIGLVSNICVITNAILVKTFSPESIVIVDSRCTSSFDEDLNQKSLDVLKGLQIKVI